MNIQEAHSSARGGRLAHHGQHHGGAPHPGLRASRWWAGRGMATGRCRSRGCCGRTSSPWTCCCRDWTAREPSPPSWRMRPPRILVVSAVADRGADLGFQAIRAGALELIAKPNVTSRRGAAQVGPGAGHLRLPDGGGARHLPPDAARVPPPLPSTGARVDIFGMRPPPEGLRRSRRSSRSCPRICPCPWSSPSTSPRASLRAWCGGSAR